MTSRFFAALRSAWRRRIRAGRARRDKRRQAGSGFAQELRKLLAGLADRR
jgi:hypothetical protein